MHTGKFNLPRPSFIKWLNVLTVTISLCALWLWHAPLNDRLLVMSAVMIASIGYFVWLTKIYLKRYPATLAFKKEDLYLNDRVVSIGASTVLTPYYASLCLNDLNKKKYRLIATQKSFANKKDYYDFIRFLKTYQGSF